MKMSAAVIILLALIATGDSLKCYEGCFSYEAGGKSSDLVTACDSSKEVDCQTDEVCSTLKISFEVSALGQTASAVMKTRMCGTADADADAACEAAKTGGDTSSFFASLSGNLDCEISTCETDLCNSGFTARVSVLVLVVAAVVFYGLF